jgi:hypothetical protein
MRRWIHLEDDAGLGALDYTKVVDLDIEEVDSDTAEVDSL